MKGFDLNPSDQIELGHAECQGFGANVPELNLRLRIQALSGQANDGALAKPPMTHALPDPEHLATHGDAG